MFFLLLSCGLETNKQTFMVKKNTRFLLEMSHSLPQKMVIISSLNRVCSYLGPCFPTSQPAGSVESDVLGIYGAGKLSSDHAKIHLKGCKLLKKMRSSEKKKREKQTTNSSI